MVEALSCIYETPYHWCSKWNKKCDCKIGNTRKKCIHQWEPTNSGGEFMGLNGIKTYTTYICKLCGAAKNIAD